MNRTRTITWEDPKPALAQARQMSGLETLHAIIAGTLPPPPIAQLFGFTIISVEPGLITMAMPTGEHLYNTIGMVHGGVAATLLDTVMGTAVHSMLPSGRNCATLEIKVSYIRPITEATGIITGQGRVINTGRNVAFAEGTITDSAGKVYATGSTTCSIWEI
jgi:uncharacterized protein (TIGR00369 family)